jgi:hypothetical protein
VNKDNKNGELDNTDKKLHISDVITSSIKPLTLVKWDYESLPENWRKENPNPYDGMTFMYFGEVNEMEGHSFLQCMKTGKHTDELLPLTEDEL